MRIPSCMVAGGFAGRVRNRPQGSAPSKARPGFIIAIGALLVFVTAIIGLVINMTGFLDTVYMDLTLTLPKFDYEIVNGEETGNETFEAFRQMRFIGAGIFGAALIYAGIVRFMENENVGIVQRGISNQIISNSLLFVIFLVAFPPLWDAGANVMDDLGLWVLNPLYSFDPDRPFPAEMYANPDSIFDLYSDSEYRVRLHGEPDRVTDLDRAEFACEPGFKVRYVFDQMMGTTEMEYIQSSYAGEGVTFDTLTRDLQNFASEAFVNLFLGLTKALVTINVLITAFVIGIMADVLIGMIIAALPVFLFLSLIPKAKKIADMFIDSLPALYLLPVLSAIVIVVGAGFLVEIQDDGGADVENTILYKWIASIGVVFLAISLPVMLVGMLGRVASMATQTVTSGVQTSAMVTGIGAAGAIRGVQSGVGAAGAANLTGLSKLGMIAGTGAAGLGHGLMSASTGAVKSSGFGGSDFAGGMPGMGGAVEAEHRDAGAAARMASDGIAKGINHGKDASPKDGDVDTDNNQPKHKPSLDDFI